MNGISPQEFSARIEQVRKEMAERELDCLIVYSWKRGQTKYLSGYYPNYVANTAAIFILPDGESKLFIRFPFDLERAHSVSWIKDIHASGTNEGMARDLCEEIRKSGQTVKKAGIIGGDRAMDEIPYSFVQIIKEDLKDAEIIDSCDIVEDIRMVKSRDEAGLIANSAKIADAAILEARRKIIPGTAEMEIVAEAESYIRRNNGGQHLVVIAAPGNQNLIRPATLRKIENGEDIILEAAVEANGYWSQIAATFTCGNQAITFHWSASMDSAIAGRQVARR